MLFNSVVNNSFYDRLNESNLLKVTEDNRILFTKKQKNFHLVEPSQSYLAIQLSYRKKRKIVLNFLKIFFTCMILATALCET